MTTKLCFLLILGCLCSNACQAQDFVPRLKNNYIELFQFKNKKLKRVKAFDSTQVVLNEDSAIDYNYNAYPCFERWAYSSKYHIIAYYNLYSTGFSEYDLDEELLDFGRGFQKNLCEYSPEDCPNGFVDTFPKAVIVYDTLEEYPIVQQEIYLVYLNKKGQIEKRDTLSYPTRVAIKSIRFFEDRLLIEGETEKWERDGNRYGFIDLKDRIKKLDYFDPPTYLKNQNFRYLETSAIYEGDFYSLQTDYFSNYSIHHGLEEGLEIVLPKIIEEQVWNTCSGHDNVQVMGYDAITFNDKWLVVGLNFGCYGQIIMFEDCFGAANMIAIIDRSTMKLNYFLNNTGYNCGDEDEKEAEVKLEMPTWDEIKVIGNVLYFVEADSVCYLDLAAPSLEEYRFEEEDDYKIRDQKTAALIAEVRTFKVPFGPPYELSELANNNVLVHNRKKGFYLNEKSK